MNRDLTAVQSGGVLIEAVIVLGVLVPLMYLVSTLADDAAARGMHLELLSDRFGDTVRRMRREAAPTPEVLLEELESLELADRANAETTSVLCSINAGAVESFARSGGVNARSDEPESLQSAPTGSLGADGQRHGVYFAIFVGVHSAALSPSSPVLELVRWW